MAPPTLDQMSIVGDCPRPHKTRTADGSTRFVSETIQVKPSSTSNPSVWDRLNLSSDNQPLSADSF